MNEQQIEATIRKAKTAAKRMDLPDREVKGLVLRITPTGAATWVLRCSDKEGRQRRYVLGRWAVLKRAKSGLEVMPEAEAEGRPLNVSAARDAARQMRARVDKGADPILEARKKRLATTQARDGIGTLQALIDLYQATDRAKRMKSWDECKRRIESVFNSLFNRPMRALTRGELQLTASKWPSPQSAAAAVRYLRPILKWAAENDHASEDLARIKPPATVKRRDRVLDRAELAALLPVLVQSDRPYAAALRFMLLTLARREEVCRARWGDVDLEERTWNISATKNGQPHVVPLSNQAAALLTARKPEKVRPSDLVFANRDGGALQNWDRETKVIMLDSETEGWTRHDLRRTGATLLGDMGELPDIIEAALNHVAIRSQLAATYNRSRYRPAVKAALQRLGDALEGIEAGPVAVDLGNVPKTDHSIAHAVVA